MIVVTGITVSSMFVRVVAADFTRVVVSVGISLSFGVIVKIIFVAAFGVVTFAPVTIEVVATEVFSKLVAVTTEVVATEVLAEDTLKVVNVVIGLGFKVTVGAIVVVGIGLVKFVANDEVISVTFV